MALGCSGGGVDQQDVFAQCWHLHGLEDTSHNLGAEFYTCWCPASESLGLICLFRPQFGSKRLKHHFLVTSFGFPLAQAILENMGTCRSYYLFTLSTVPGFSPPKSA